MDPYEKLIQGAKEEQAMLKPSKNAVKNAVRASKSKLILSTLTTLLLIVPVCTMLTFFYYAFGTKSTTLMDVASQTLYVTDPNTSLEELEFDMDFSLFSMNLTFEQYKQIGAEIYPTMHYELTFLLNDLVDKKTTTQLEKKYPLHPTETNQWLAHPKNKVEFNSSQEWSVLRGLPEETVVEAYVSFDDLYMVEEIEKSMPHVDVTWAAIYTGVEETMLSAGGNVVSPIGYPVQPDDTYWSPFRESESHAQTFMDMLHFLNKYEKVATEVSKHKNLELPERINYLEKHPMQTYAAVITGPKAEIEALQQQKMIKYFKLGEVKLWNWTK